MPAASSTRLWRIVERSIIAFGFLSWAILFDVVYVVRRVRTVVHGDRPTLRRAKFRDALLDFMLFPVVDIEVPG